LQPGRKIRFTERENIWPLTRLTVRANPMLGIIIGCMAGLIACVALALTMTLVGWFFAGAVLALVGGLVALPFETDPNVVELNSASPQSVEPEPARERAAITSIGGNPCAARQ